MPKVDLELFRPNELVLSVSAIDFEKLYNMGFHHVIFDKDGTLTEPNGGFVLPDAKESVNTARDRGYIADSCVLSNLIISWRAKDRKQRLISTSQEIHAHPVDLYIPHLKPDKHGFEQCLQIMGAQAKRTVVVGDQLHTDILGGNLMDMYTILCKPCGSHPITWYYRYLERGLFHELGISFDHLSST